MSRIFERTEDDEIPIVYGLQFGHSIFSCDRCKKIRSYGYGVPEQKKVLLVCEFCGKHMWHTFTRVY